ncbi:dihydrofolate reductase [Dysgonomonas sp. Marseille-P4677]|uniref:dihydrofolate reductase family protein n=1 Tax=Dysgonomonas sp. Marseille-P4677 TaxID=2364790 RepID=UPI0019120003|nr:dihydrofolate reductase family protein [Dysgonomonas sp. Marseille-P4677]MBK5719535.1 dihydrofolate reductase [Dysgonomonas sp. Marseille-P4677]
MKKIKLYIASTIDGYIATSDGDLDWLREFPNSEKSDFGYKNFMSGIDAVLIGGQTYRSLLCMDVVWPYKSKTTYIISRKPIDIKIDCDIYNITKNAIEEIAKIKNEEGGDIALFGGGILTKMLLQHDMIDEMTISTIPILLGGGISLFPVYFPTSSWYIEKTELFKNGLMQTVYRKVSE